MSLNEPTEIRSCFSSCALPVDGLARKQTDAKRNIIKPVGVTSTNCKSCEASAGSEKKGGGGGPRPSSKWGLVQSQSDGMFY